MMGRLSSNLFANLAGQGWSVLISIAVIPVYVRLLGVEAYGLIGFYAVLQGVLPILDLGLRPTLIRELARRFSVPQNSGETRDLVRTLEIVCWLTGILVSAGVVVLAPLIASHWIKASALSTAEVQEALRLMGVLLLFQWMTSFYQSGLMGLEHQVLANGLTMTFATAASGGSILILWWFPPTVRNLFGFQLAVGVIQAAVTAFFLWRGLPSSPRPPRFGWGFIQNTWRFAAGMGGITVASVVLTQADKVILSKMLSLKVFGYYTLASAVGRSLYVFITPVFNAVFPRFSALAVPGEPGPLKRVYHESSQLMSVLILPVMAIVALFSRDIFSVWVGDAEVTRLAAPVAAILVVGTAINGLMNLPYALQLAHGWTSVGLGIVTVLIVIFGPMIYFMTTIYGAQGAAWAWLLLNFLYMCMGIPLTHRRLLRSEAGRWLIRDIFGPLLAVLLVAAAAWTLAWEVTDRPIVLARLSLVLLAAFVAAVMAAPLVRNWVFGWLRSKHLDHV